MMNKYGKLITENTLVFERLLPGTIDQIWEYLVDSENRGKWFASGDIKFDGELELIFNNSQLSNPPDTIPAKYAEFGDGFRSKAKVIVNEPPNKLVIDWSNGIITFELVEIDNLVKLTLTHDRLHHNPDERIGAMAGWHAHLDVLSDALLSIDHGGFWKNHTKLEKEYEEHFVK